MGSELGRGVQEVKEEIKNESSISVLRTRRWDCLLDREVEKTDLGSGDCGFGHVKFEMSLSLG